MDDLDRDAALFDQSVPVRLEQPNRDLRVIPLTIRVLAGRKQSASHTSSSSLSSSLSSSSSSSRASAHARSVGREMLHMEITDPHDPFFLYTLQVTDEDFHDLKHDQSLLVDFASFAPKFIELLQSCQEDHHHHHHHIDSARREPDNPIAFNSPSPTLSPSPSPSQSPTASPTSTSTLLSRHQRQPSFLAELSLVDRPVLRIVETNKFKHLTHLALRFQPGNDESIKAYLVSRLQQSSNHNARLNNSLQHANTELSATRTQCKRLESELSDLEHTRAARERELEAKHQQEFARLQEKHAAAISELQTSTSEHSRESQTQSEARIDALTAELRELTEENRVLRDEKVNLEAELKAVSNRLQVAETGLKTATEDVVKLRKDNAVLDNAKHENDKEVSKLTLRLAAATQQVLDKESLLNKTSDLLAAANEQRTNMQDKLEAHAATTTKLQRKLQLSISEIKKGNQVIARLQQQLKHADERLKTKSLVIRRQEEKLEEKKRQVETLDRKMFEIDQQLQSSLQQSLKLQEQKAADEAKLAEAHNALESNQNVISYLNKEINKLQLGGGVPSVGATDVASTSPLRLVGNGAVSTALPDYTFSLRSSTTPVGSTAAAMVDNGRHTASTVRLSEGGGENKYASFGSATAPLTSFAHHQYQTHRSTPASAAMGAAPTSASRTNTNGIRTHLEFDLKPMSSSPPPPPPLPPSSSSRPPVSTPFMVSRAAAPTTTTTASVTAGAFIPSSRLSGSGSGSGSRTRAGGR